MITTDRLERLNNLTPAKRALLLKHIQKEATPTEESSLIPRRARLNPSPLSFAQQRLWFLTRLEPDAPFYNVPTTLSLKGQLDIDALERTVNEIIRRHEVLRTTFVEADGQPVQIVAPAEWVALPLINLSEFPCETREAETQRHINNETRKPLDLSTGPLLRVSLLRLETEAHVLLVTMHHIISDGWSMGLFIREMSALYQAFAAGQESPLPDLEIQYADFAAWQRQWLTGEVLDEQLGYWKEQLAGAPPVLELPTDRPRPAVQSYRGARHSFSLSGELTAALRELSQRAGCTLFMTLLAAFQVLLSRYSGQEDVVVGTPIANRNRAEVEPLIGFFVNTLALRTDLSGAPSFREVLKRVREVTLSAYGHQDVPFEKLVEELQPERSLSHQPLFQVMFALQNAPREKLDLPGLDLELWQNESQTTKFDLLLSLTESGEGLSGALEYSTDLFEEATIRQLRGHFERLLEAIIADAEQEVGSITLLTAAEHEQVIVQWNETSTEYPQDRCVHEMFEEQAARTPHAIAVECEGEQLSYAELNQRANQLAHHLRGLGVDSEALVGILLERSLEMVVAVLGVLKAGGAYLPLDVSYPAQRVQYMLEETQAAVLLTQRGLKAQLPEHGATVIAVDEQWEEIAKECAENPSTKVCADNLAYVIYTSGSTGQPKGTAVTHRAICRLLFNTNYVTLASTDRMAQVSNASFDAATFELWGALLHGACLVFIPRDVTLSPREFAAQLVSHRISVMFLTTALFNHLANTVPDAFNTLRCVLAGGEACDPRCFRRVLEHGGPAHLLHVYGPTESTTFATFEEIVEVSQEAVTLPIGQPISNTEVYVLDEQLTVVPIGVSGELYIGGDGLARGYLNEPHLTAEKFIPHPFSQREGARVYRTGDRVRWLGNGRLEFVGRRDRQVKVRGYRIELGEIEAVLRQQPGVTDALVLVSGAGAETQIVAYVVGTIGEQFGGREIRERVKAQLPEFMIPARVVEMERLPLTPNGKVDHQSLLSLEPDTQEFEADYQAARTPVEEIICGIWSDVLKAERVGVKDNFFELGGHSLLATQIISRVRKDFSTEIPLKELFESPIVEDFAARIEESRGMRQRTLVAPLAPVSRTADLPASFAQQRMWFLYQLQPESSAYNLSSTMRLTGHLNIDLLQQTFSEIVSRHEILRTTFAEVDGQLVQIITPNTAILLVPTDLSALPADEREAAARRLVGEDARRPFDLSTGPLLRASLLRLETEAHVLLVTMHHIISDGWSMGVIVREIKALYAAFAAGQESPLPDLEIQYADFAAWQRQWLTGEVLDEQLGYWKEQLAGAPPVLELPTDRPRPAVQSYRGASQQFQLTPQLTQQLTALSQRAGCTLFMTLLAAFQVLLSRYSGQEDVVVGTPIANRNRAEVEPLIGFFVNTLALRTDLSGAPSFREVLKRVREVTLSAYGHQDVPFEKLVEELQPERSLSHQPLFQVVFALQNAADETLELPGLALSSFSEERKTAKFDLLLNIWTQGERLGGNFEYSTDLFEEATIQRLRGHFERLLEAIIADAEQEVGSITLLTAAEHEQVIVRWNETEAVYRQDKCVHEMFEQQAARTPHAIAVECEGEQLSYAELNQRANQLAHHLRGLGVDSEALVGILLERSLEMVVAVLGVLKAGAAYVPLDASHPPARLSFTLADAGVTVLVTQHHLRAQVAGSPTRVLLLDGDSQRAQIAARSVENPALTPNAEQLAYVIYTSGSTGQPKGVAVRHTAVVNFLSSMAISPGLSASDSVLALTSLAFDIAVLELLLPLAVGARVIIATREVVNDSQALKQLLRSSAATTLQATPATYHLLLENDRDFFQHLSLCRLLCGGEALTTELAAQMVATGIQVWNLYGPTETTIWSSVQLVEQVTGSIALGRPIANTQLYVLDEKLRPTPVGVKGELYIGGEGLARGYVGRPELTAERFVPDPFSGHGGARLYKTGDIVRYQAGGELLYLGRSDAQVKLRGYRIELGEIEAALCQEDGISEAVVLTKGEGAQKRLVAYVVGTGGAAEGDNSRELRRRLKEQLPEYMVPAQMVMLERLPLTPNGKVDRKALESYEGVTKEEEFVSPRTSTEEALARIWRKVLEVERVSVEANFFELGGHSLLAARVVHLIHQELKINLPLHKVFEEPTIAGLALIAQEIMIEEIENLSDDEAEFFLNEYEEALT